MINIIDIENHISRELKRVFPGYDMYVEDNRKDIKGDAFIISVRPILTTNAMQHVDKLVNVDIAYLSKNGTNRENHLALEKLESIFDLTLRVKDRRLYIKDLSISTVDTVLNLAFTLDYSTSKAKKYREDLGYGDGDIRYMEELEIRR